MLYLPGTTFREMPKLLAPERAGCRLLYWLVMVAMLPSSFFKLTVNFSL
jgi:hypothetical protein